MHLKSLNKQPDNTNKHLPSNNTTKFNPSAYQHLGITEREVFIYKNIFDEFCTNNKEYLSPGDLRNIFKYLGINATKKETFQVLCDFDTKEHGYLDFEDFLKVITD